MRFKKDEEFISEVEIKPKTELEQVTKSCFIVFSSREDHIENVIDSIEMVIKDQYDFTVKRLDKEIGSDEGQYETILDLLKECSFGIVILDGLRPNVMFEYGLLKGLGKPVMAFKEKNAEVDVRNFYIDKTESAREDIENPKIDYDKHLSDIKDRNYKEYDKNNLRDFRQILDDDFVKHTQDIINEIRRMMTPKGLISEEGLMSEQLNVIANKLAKTAKELIDQDELEIDHTVKIISNLANEFMVEMPSEYYFGLGNIYSNRQKYDKAIVYYDILLDRNPEDSAALENRGYALFYLGRFSEALVCIDRALEIDQKGAVAWDIRALILFELGKLDDAIKSHDKALDLNPKERIFWYNKWVTLSSSGMHEEAIECCNKALERDPEDAKFWELKAENLYYLGKFDDVLVWINKVLEIEPENYRALGNKAVTLHKLGRTNDALECINKALKINQKAADLWYQKGTLAEDFNEAIKYFGKALEFNPNFVEPLCSKGSNLSNIGKYDEALKIFDEVENKCEKYDKCEIISMNKGITLFKIGKSKEAFKHFDKALELNPEYTPAYCNISEHYLITKNYLGAHEMAKRALNIAEKSEDILISLFLIFCSSLFQNKKEDAEHQLNRLMEYLETINDWTLKGYLFSDIQQAIENSDVDEKTKSLTISLIELLEKKITLGEFKKTFLGVK